MKQCNVRNLFVLPFIRISPLSLLFTWSCYMCNVISRYLPYRNRKWLSPTKPTSVFVLSGKTVQLEFLSCSFRSTVHRKQTSFYYAAWRKSAWTHCRANKTTPTQRYCCNKMTAFSHFGDDFLSFLKHNFYSSVGYDRDISTWHLSSN